jgi:Lon protease-like protein
MTCLTSDRLFGSVLIERGSEVGGGDQRVQVGTLLQIIDTQESPDGRWSVLAAGVERLQVVEWLADDPFPRCIADRLPDGPQTPETDRLRDLAVDLIDQPELPHLDEDPSLASFQLLSLSPLGPLDQLKALQMPDPSSRLRFLVELLESEILVFDALSGGDGNQPSDGSSN